MLFRSGSEVDGFGGGEQRWTANLAHFLKSEGYEVVRCAEGQDAGCDLFFDASWELCTQVRAPFHIHFSFFGWTSGIVEYPCIHTGNCNLAVPYRSIWANQRTVSKVSEFTYRNIFIPQPYPDNLMPAEANSVPGFNRREILWATKDMFHPNFESQSRPDGREQVFVQSGLDTLRALLRLQKKAEFKMNFLLKHLIDQAHSRFEVPRMLDEFKEKQYWNQVPWTQLVNIAARCKLNVPVGGLWGSIPESIFTKGLPVFYQRNCWSNEFATMLPFPEHADEQDIYEALETFWFDERVYKRNYEIQQVLFEDHRTEGLRTNLKLAFEQIGL